MGSGTNGDTRHQTAINCDKWLKVDQDRKKVCKALEDGPINIDWFQGGRTNICYNALDKHVKEGHGDSVAVLWEGNSPAGTQPTITLIPSLLRSFSARYVVALKLSSS